LIAQFFIFSLTHAQRRHQIDVGVRYQMTDIRDQKGANLP
jgi:hypothetical protein